MNLRPYTPAMLFLVMALTTSCRHSENNELSHSHSNEAEKLESHEHSSSDIILEPEAAEQFGVKTEIVKKTQIISAIHTTGVLLTTPSEDFIISAPTNGIVSYMPSVIIGENVKSGQKLASISAKNSLGDNPNVSADAAIKAAKRELDRIKPLLDDGIATMSEYNDALSAYENAKASYSPSSAKGAITANFNGTIVQILATSGQFVETGTPLLRLSRNKSLVLRADLPEADLSEANKITNAKIKLPSSNEWLDLSNYHAQRIDNTDLPSSAGYIPIYFRFSNVSELAVGTFVNVELMCNDKSEGFSIPKAALIEQQGNYFVFVKTGDHSYQKRQVTLGAKSADMVEVTSGVADGDCLVTAGVTSVKLAETSGAVPEGHSHNH